MEEREKSYQNVVEHLKDHWKKYLAVIWIISNVLYVGYLIGIEKVEETKAHSVKIQKRSPKKSVKIQKHDYPKGAIILGCNNEDLTPEEYLKQPPCEE